MSSVREPPAEPAPPVGLRERKKAKTRTAIQHEALRLFRQNGYEATTIDQIVEAVEVSPSTFFRYFPTKEDVVLTDDYDPLLIGAFRAQPPELGPIAAFRAALAEVFGRLSEEEMADSRQRTELIFSVPELRAAMLEQLTGTIRQISEMAAERMGRDPEDVSVRTLAGATLGVMIVAVLWWAEHPDGSYMEVLDESLARLEAGFAL